MAVPAIAEPAKLLEYTFTDPTGLDRTVPNHNDTWLAGYPGATGLKPGFTEKANRTLVASATREGRTCVAVVLGVYDVVGWAAKLNDQCFATPVAAQKGAERLPPVRVATVDARRAVIDGFPRALGAPALGSAATTASDATDTTDPEPRPTAADEPEREVAAARVERDTSEVATETVAATDGSSRFTFRNLLIVALVVLVVVVLLRRRAVKRQRQRRMARQRMLADARRRGVLHVLDPEGTGEVSHVNVVPRNGRKPQRTRTRS